MVHGGFARCAARFGEVLGEGVVGGWGRGWDGDGGAGGMLGEQFGGWCGGPRGKTLRGALGELPAVLAMWWQASRVGELV